MSRKFLMGDLVDRCLDRADLPVTGSGPWSRPKVKALISEQYGHLYSVVVQAGFRYFESSTSITATGATSYALPTDHDCTIGIDRVIDASTGQVDQLDELMIQERDRLSGAVGDACYYSVVGQSIVLYPRPSSGTYMHLYVPQSPDISALADTSEVDVVTADGEAFLIYGVAVKLMAKTEADPRLCASERDAAEVRFTRDVGLRAVVNPRRRIVRPTPFEWDEVYW